jgi:hypothetical protein
MPPSVHLQKVSPEGKSRKQLNLGFLAPKLFVAFFSDETDFLDFGAQNTISI